MKKFHKIKKIIPANSTNNVYSSKKIFNVSRKDHNISMEKILNNIKSFCKNKRIIVIGNSSDVLKIKNVRSIIEGHDIIVRMNWAVPTKTHHLNLLGNKTDIYVVGISNQKLSHMLIAESKSKYVLRLNPHGESLNSHICYSETKESYDEIKKEFSDYKPSTGCLAIKFFKDHIDYSELTIIGFSFFKNESENSVQKNEFRSFKHKDHNTDLEESYILKQLDERTKIIML